MQVSSGQKAATTRRLGFNSRTETVIWFFTCFQRRVNKREKGWKKWIVLQLYLFIYFFVFYESCVSFWSRVLIVILLFLRVLKSFTFKSAAENLWKYTSWLDILKQLYYILLGTRPFCIYKPVCWHWKEIANPLSLCIFSIVRLLLWLWSHQIHFNYGSSYTTDTLYEEIYCWGVVLQLIMLWLKRPALSGLYLLWSVP